SQTSQGMACTEITVAALRSTVVIQPSWPTTAVFPEGSTETHCGARSRSTGETLWLAGSMTAKRLALAVTTTIRSCTRSYSASTMLSCWGSDQNPTCGGQSWPSEDPLGDEGQSWSFLQAAKSSRMDPRQGRRSL